MIDKNNYDSYPLSPLQQGMLFHSLSAIGSGVDIEQIIITIHEALDVPAFELAWKHVINRHPILRSGFRWEGVEEPVQIVEQEVNLPLKFYDHKDLPILERDIWIDEFLSKDRLHDFKITDAPLMRLTIFKLGESEYKCIWTFHHILLDGRSFPLVLEEIFNLYDIFPENRELSLEQPQPYRDYIEWLRSRDLAEDEKYWRQTLSGFTAPTPLPSAFSSPDKREMGSEGAEELHLSSKLTSALQSFSGENNLTLNTLIQGSWALLLHHYSDENDIVFGATRSCRRSTIEGADSMIGLFINTLPMRVEMGEDKTILTWLKELREQHVVIRKYEHSPLHKVQQWSDVPPGTPLFESLVVFENYLLNSYLRAKGGKWLNREFIYRGRTNYPLTLLCYADNEMLLRVEYDQDRFDQKTVQRMLGHIWILLESIITNPDKYISELPILTKAERHQILYEWNATQKNYPMDKCLHELFEEQVERAPDNIALVFGNEHLTYKELNVRANQLAHFLRALGVRPEVPVGVYMERSFEMVISLYSVLKAGGAYVPLDPEHPPKRVAFMLEDTRVPVILTQKHLVESIPDNSAKLVCVDADWPEISKEDSDNLKSGVTAENLAYVIFTSGSTGRPKGVMNEHRGICNRLIWMQDEYQLNDTDHIFQKTPYSFDVSVWEFFWPLLYGARLVVAQPGGHRDSAYLVKTIVDEEITTIHFVPSMLQIFLEDKNVKGCKCLKRVICSGEALPYDLQERFFERLDAELHNLYGPTEAAVDVTYWACQQDIKLRIVPIGRPVANTQTYILNRYMQPVPIGISGELHLGGIQIARGYINQPDLTAEKFIPDLFSNEPGARLYKTGDICRYLPDGNIEYLGRKDFQIKIRGLRIEIGEIESVLIQHPAVREAVVIAREDVPGDKRLVAYLVAKQQANINIDELRNFLKAKLADYMVPSAFVQLEAFNLTSSGKVDRRALPAPEGKRQTEKAYVAPQSEVEKIIAETCQDLLKIEKVGVNDNFFDLGGHSLLLVRMMNKLQESFKKELSIVDMFQWPSIKELAKFLSDDQRDETSFDKIQDRTMKQKEILRRQKQRRTWQGNINE